MWSYETKRSKVIIGDTGLDARGLILTLESTRTFTVSKLTRRSELSPAHREGVSRKLTSLEVLGPFRF